MADSGSSSIRKALYVQDAAPAEDVQQTKRSWLQGLCASRDVDVIPPSSSSARSDARSDGRTSRSGSRTWSEVSPGIGSTDFPPGSMVVVDYLKSYAFPLGLCKTVVNYVENTPWRIVLVDCSSAVESTTLDRMVGAGRSPPRCVEAEADLWSSGHLVVLYCPRG